MTYVWSPKYVLYNGPVVQNYRWPTAYLLGPNSPTGRTTEQALAEFTDGKRQTEITLGRTSDDSDESEAHRQ
jgi:hypothetical protein